MSIKRTLLTFILRYAKIWNRVPHIEMRPFQIADRIVALLKEYFIPEISLLPGLR